MVDPNRKINRLTDKDIEFLEECEREFALRYTEEDADFMEHCAKPLDDPPIIENWNSSDFARNDSGGHHHNRGGNRNHRNWRGNFRNRRGGWDNFNDSNGSASRSSPYKRPSFNQQQNSTSQAPMNIRRDYKNFVAASKDD